MALGGFGDRSTVDLLLEITGRDDAGSALRSAAQDMAALKAAQDALNSSSKEGQRAERARLDLQRAAEAQALRLKAAEQDLSETELARADRETRAWQAARNEIFKHNQEISRTNAILRDTQDMRDRAIQYNERLGRGQDAFTGRMVSNQDLQRFQAYQKAYRDQASALETYGQKEDHYRYIAQDFQRALEQGNLRLNEAKTRFGEASRASQDFGKNVERNGGRLDALGQKVENIGNRFQRFGGPMWSRLLGNLVGGGLQGFGKVLQAGGNDAQSLDRIAQGMGGVVAIGGGFLALMSAIPIVVGVATVAITALGDAIGTLVAVGAGLAAPLTLLTAFLAGPAVALGYTISQLTSQQSNYQTALTNLHSAQSTYQNDLKSTSATALETKTALERLHTAQAAFVDARQIHRLAAPLAPDIRSITHSFDSITATAEQRLLPFITMLAGQAKNFLSYLAQVVKLPLPQMFHSLATTGVDKIFRDLEQIGHRVGPLIRDALYAAFTDSGNLHNKLVILWNQITSFFLGRHGALIPAAKWWDAQHFTQEGIGLFHTFAGFLDRTGVFNMIGQALITILKDAIATGFRLGFDALKGEFGFLSQMIAAAIVAGIALSLSGVGIAGGITTGIGGLIGMLSGGAGIGAAGIGLGLGTAAAVAAPAAAGVGTALLLEHVFDHSTTARTVGQIQAQLNSLRAATGVTVPNVRQVLMTNALQLGARTAPLALAGVHIPAAQITRIEQQMLQGMGIGRTSPLGQLGLTLSRAAGRALAPNELQLLHGVRANIAPALGTFASITHLLPSQHVLKILVNHQQASQAIAALIGETRKLPTRHQLHVLSNIPTVAIPAVAHLIQRIHGIPTHHQLKVTIQGAEQAKQHFDNLVQKRVHLTQLMAHKDRFGAPDTSALDRKIADAQAKLQGFSGHTKSLFTQPIYEALGQSIPDGLAAGIRAGMPALIAQAQAMANQVHSIVANALKNPHSPSPLYIPLGESIVQGLSAGMLKAAGGAKQAAQTIMQTILSTYQSFQQQFTGLFGALFAGPAGTGVTPRTGFQTRLAQLQGFPGAKVPFSAVAGDLRAQVGTFRRFVHSLRRLEREGYPEGLIQQIAAIGPSAQPEIDALLGANRGQRRRYSHLFHDQQRLINEASRFALHVQAGQWRALGHSAAFGILAGLQSVAPQLRALFHQIINESFRAPHHHHHHHGHVGQGRHGGGHHARSSVTVNQTIIANPSESLDRTLRRSAMYYKALWGAA